MSLSLSRFAALGLAAVVACGDDDPDTPPVSTDPNDLTLLRQVLDTNADIAFAAYSDSVSAAEAMKAAVETFLMGPSPQTFANAKAAWLAAREPYGQTEVYRFRASPIDDTNYDVSDGEDGPEGDINAWPLGEALIDYVVQGTDFGEAEVGVTAHQTGVADPIGQNTIINSTSITIDADLLANTATAEDEHDVIAGYHAIEFLLWGQDLNADGSADTVTTRDMTAGQRPHTDFIQGAGCTSGPTAETDGTLCTRRATYLRVAIDKLIADLTSVRDAWAAGASYRTAFTTVADLEEGKGRLLEILTGMGTLSEGELGGERMQISLSANSQEDEHSCFSDNTHRDIWLNAEGVQNSYRGEYAGYDSTGDGTDDMVARAVSGYGWDDYLKDVGFETLAGEIETALATTAAGYQAIDAAARQGMTVDRVIIDASSEAARPMRDTIIALNAQATQIARIATELGLGDASDVVDPDASECDTSDPTSSC
ncbi:MAG: imelysin family protein [Myxococcota bacterium]